MYDILNSVYGVACRTVDNNGTATVGPAFDTRTQGGMGMATCIVVTGNQAGTSSVFKITECDTIGGTYTDITADYYKLGSSMVLQSNPSTLSWTALAATDDNKVFVAHVPLGGPRKRFLKLNITNSAAASLVGAVWVGSHVAQAPSTVTDASGDLTGGAGSTACVGEILFANNNA